MTKGKMRRAYLLGIMWCVLAATVLISSTYAWFTLRAVAEVTPLRGTIGTADGTLLISNRPDGGFDVSCELIPDGSFVELKPVSTVDLDRFYRLDFYDMVHKSYRYTDAGNRVSTDVIHGHLYLQSQDSGFDVYFHPQELQVMAGEQTLAAVRIGFILKSHEGNRSVIFKGDSFGSGDALKTVRDFPQTDSVVGSLGDGGQAQYVSDPAGIFSDYMAAVAEEGQGYVPGRQKLCSIARDEIAELEYFVYLEGCDIHCLNELQGGQIELQFGFAGVPIRAEVEGEETGLE